MELEEKKTYSHNYYFMHREKYKLMAREKYEKNKKSILKKLKKQNKIKKEEYDNLKKEVAELKLENLVLKQKLEVVKNYYIQKNNIEAYNICDKIINLNDNYKFLKLLYCGNKDEYAYATYTGYISKKDVYNDTKDRDYNVIIKIRCLHVPEPEFEKIYTTQIDKPIPFFILFTELIHVAQIYEICACTQTIFYDGEK